MDLYKNLNIPPKDRIVESDGFPVSFCMELLGGSVGPVFGLTIFVLSRKYIRLQINIDDQFLLLNPSPKEDLKRSSVDGFSCVLVFVIHAIRIRTP